MTKRKRLITWYVHATGHTNEAIARRFAQSPEKAQRLVPCSDGVRRNMWVCDYPFISELLENEASNHLKFRVFRKEGRHGLAMPWKFLKRPKPTLGESLKKGEIRMGVRDLLAAGQELDLADAAKQRDWENEK